MLNQRLSQKLLQKLSPQQIQLMKLLQVPTASIEMRIKEELEANPALEEGMEEEQDADDLLQDEHEADNQEDDFKDDLDLTEYMGTDDDIPSYKMKNGQYSDEEERTIPARVIRSFQEHLLDQLGLQDLDEHKELVAVQLVGSIDDDGYLRRDLDALIDDLAFSRNIITDREEIEELLTMIQGFDPIGVGGRDLRECLLLQLKHADQEDEIVKLAIRILTDYFDEFAKKHYTKIMKSLKIDDDDLRDILDEILKLNPKPGSSFAEGATKMAQYITPDFIINNEDGELVLSLNGRNAPELRISQAYKDMFSTYAENKKKDKAAKEAVMFIKQKIDSAKWFIDAMMQRQATLHNTMQTLLDYQYQYFLTGDETTLKPMILKDIAEITGLDISTVSRVANSKYVQTEFGTFQLKSFFSESLTNHAGEEVSTREVKKILTDLIEAENKKKPLSDQKLMEELKEKGYNIARRTVAKYREQLNIPVARLRKEI